MPEAPPPTLRLRLDEAALAANWCALDAMSGKARAGAAVKSDCYGLGVKRCLPVLRDAGVRDFFVAHWSEVEAVMAHVPAAQISVLHGVLNAADAAYARVTGARPVIDSLQQARVWAQSGGGRCDLMVDTGINRLGVSPAQVADPLIQGLDIEVLMSHLACADEDSAMNARQLSAFREIIPRVAHREASLANSAGIALGGDYHCDLTRPGLALYGGVPRAEFADTIHQVAYPEAALLQVRDLPAGASVGYNAAFTAPAPMRVGVVSLGYADGMLRAWAGANLTHGERPLPILGKVSMDMVVVDLAQAPELCEGDWLSLPYHLPDAARQTSLSQYELLTVLGNRFD